MAKKYWWVNGRDLRKAGFFEMVTQAGADGMRLEFHPDDVEPFKWVDIETGEICGSYDFVHTCPPDCN